MWQIFFYKYAKIEGALALVLVGISVTLMIIAGNYGILQDKAKTNIKQNYEAYEAAQAGLEYGINYLNVNNGTILASPVSGHLAAFSNSNTTNVVLGNNSKYTITYSNPIANNYTLIKITSTGSNGDSTATHTVSQLFQFGSTLVKPPTVPLTAKSTISLSGHSQIINTYNNNTIATGSTVTIGGSASTILSSGTSSTSGNIKSDISQNLASLSSLSNNDFFASYFGNSPSNIKTGFANQYSNSSSTDYSGILGGMTGTSIWIDQTGATIASIHGNTTVGTAANPVLMVVNGDLDISGNVTIYGYVFVLGNSTTDFLGNLTIYGGVATTGQISASGSIQVLYSPTVLSTLQNTSTMRYYARVPGSWKDF